MKLALAQINPVIGDIAGNKKKILDGYKKGVAEGCGLVIFPELALLGYPPLDLVEKQGFRKAVYTAVEEIAAVTGETGLLFGSITEDKNTVGTNLFNSAVLCYNGEVQFVQQKTLIPNYDVFDEMRYFEPAKEVYIHQFRGKKLGISICEDIWNDKDYWKHRLYSNDPVERLLQKGADLLINISASPYSYGKRTERKEMLATLCGKDKVPLAYCCCTGAQTDLLFDGGSMCFDGTGRLVQLGKIFEEDFIVFDPDAEYQPIERVEGIFEEEVLNGVIMGVRDYALKLGFKKALLGLSGGIDSALVAYIAVRALGKDNVHVVMLPSRYSSTGSITDSDDLIKNLGISSATISIQQAVDSVLQTLAPSFEGVQADVTEENIQSRMRGVLLMGLANKFGYLLLTTGNKSEVATGYCTLYGDMCGGLAVIADIYKTDVWRIAEYINRDREIIPRAIVEKIPSAELRPNQTDQDSLPPYNMLDDILRDYLENNKEYDEIVEDVGEPDIVRRILRLVDINEFKRKQAAPALKVSYKAFGYGRRYPIVQKWR
ncbi:MAG: NAD+ synthase [Ignavibacteriales bacterium]|nr:NAD+ synthase [Ignavibacteriales bacterium]